MIPPLCSLGARAQTAGLAAAADADGAATARPPTPPAAANGELPAAAGTAYRKPGSKAFRELSEMAIAASWFLAVLPSSGRRRLCFVRGGEHA